MINDSFKLLAVTAITKMEMEEGVEKNVETSRNENKKQQKTRKKFSG